MRGAASDPAFVLMLGGAPARRFLAGGSPPSQAYWLRVWAARGLVWAGAEEVQDDVRDALRDESWRVREMACRVIARHRLDDLLDDVAPLEHDRVARVRQAAARAVLAIVGGAGAV